MRWLPGLISDSTLFIIWKIPLKKVYCIVLHCVVLSVLYNHYYTLLYCIVLLLYCIVLYFTVLYCIALYCVVLYCSRWSSIFQETIHVDEQKMSVLPQLKATSALVKCSSLGDRFLTSNKS